MPEPPDFDQIASETERALAEAKQAIEAAVTAAADRLRTRTGLLATVEIETLNLDTYGGRARGYVARLKFSA